jgi:hypothetical protein
MGCDPVGGIISSNPCTPNTGQSQPLYYESNHPYCSYTGSPPFGPIYSNVPVDQRQLQSSVYNRGSSPQSVQVPSVPPSVYILTNHPNSGHVMQFVGSPTLPSSGFSHSIISQDPHHHVPAAPIVTQPSAPSTTVATNPQEKNSTKSIPIVTLNPNNFSDNPSKIRYVPGEVTRKRPVSHPESELDTLNAKRIKNREAARRWRQGKKEQIADLQDEVSSLKSKLDTLQTENETLRIENRYLKQELDKVRKTPSLSPSPPKITTDYHNPVLRNGTHYSDIEFLPTPSLFLLCLFVFSLCLSFPSQRYPLFPGTEPTAVSSPLMSANTRQPRLLHADAAATLPYLKTRQTSSFLSSFTGLEFQQYWFFSMFSTVYELLPFKNVLHRDLGASIGILKPEDMNKKLSHSLRLDGFL